MSRKLLTCLAPALGLLLSPIGDSRLKAGEGVTSPNGPIRLPSGLTAFYDYHFNRNAIRGEPAFGFHAHRTHRYGEPAAV